METSLITYSLTERGRQYRGKERRFNLRALAACINGPECQERIRNRDMLGYYGHWPRIKFGMNPAEGGLVAGKPSLVEPALVTTHLQARDDGTVEHRAEFLATDSGAVAAKLYSSRAGGFSSAIDPGRPEFFGFDYVLEPNYSTNRGYSLDDVHGLSPDDIEAAIYGEQLQGMMRLLDSAHGERERALETIDHLRAENEQLLSLLASKGAADAAVLDAVPILPLAVSRDAAQRLQRDTEIFRTAVLPSFVLPETEEPPEAPRLYGRLLSRFTR